MIGRHRGEDRTALRAFLKYSSTEVSERFERALRKYGSAEVGDRPTGKVEPTDPVLACRSFSCNDVVARRLVAFEAISLPGTCLKLER